MQIRGHFKSASERRSRLCAKDRLIVDIEPKGAPSRISIISTLNTGMDEQNRALEPRQTAWHCDLNARAGAA
jgi:hypothetical protein